MRFLTALSLFAFAVACGKQNVDPPDPGFQCADHPGMGAKIAELSSDLDFRECFMRTHESPAGNFVADAVWWALQDNHWSAELTSLATSQNVRFYLDNSGGVQMKAVVPRGEICETGYISKTTPGQGDLSTGKPFADTLLPHNNWVIFVTMAQSKLRQVLERSFAINETTVPAVDYPNKDGSFLTLSSNVQVKVEFADYTNQAQKVKKPSTTRAGAVITEVLIDGNPIDLNSDQLITFATTNFVAGIDIVGGEIKAGTEPGKGAGVAAGFTSDYFSNDQLPATNTFTIVEQGKDVSLPTVFSPRAAMREYIEAHPVLDPQVTGRYVYANQTRVLNLCL